MATSGQTDTTTKSCWWFITVNNFTQEELQLAKTQHRIIKSSRGVEEIGGESKIHHFHCLLNTDHVRWSQIKDLFPRANIIPKYKGAKDDSVQTSIDYIEGTSKKKIDNDTAIPGTRWYVQHRGESALSFGDNLKRLAEFSWTTDEINAKLEALGAGTALKVLNEIYKDEYWHCVNQVIDEDLNLLAIYSQTQYLTSWLRCRRTIIRARQTDNTTVITFIPTTSIEDGQDATHSQ